MSSHVCIMLSPCVDGISLLGLLVFIEELLEICVYKIIMLKFHQVIHNIEKYIDTNNYNMKPVICILTAFRILVL